MMEISRIRNEKQRQLSIDIIIIIQSFTKTMDNNNFTVPVTVVRLTVSAVMVFCVSGTYDVFPGFNT